MRIRLNIVSRRMSASDPKRSFAVDLRSIEDTAVIELLLTRPERKVER